MLQIRSAGQIYSQAHQLKKNQKLKSSSTQKLKLLSFILQNYSIFRAVLAKIQAIKQVNCHFFQSFIPSDMFNFKKKTCILYHLAFLDWLPTRNFLSPITRFQPLKSHFLTTILPFLPCIPCFQEVLFIQLWRIFMLFVLHSAAFCTAFSTILPCVQHQNALRLAPKCTAFSTKTHCVLRHIALHAAINSPKVGVNGGLFK